MDGQTLYYPGDDEAVLTNPTVKLQAGYAGTFECAVPPINPLYKKIKNRSSMVSVFRDTTEIFYGEVRKQPKIDRYKNKNVYCAGAMSFLADSIQPQAEYNGMTPRQMLGTFLDIHNSQVEDRKKVYLGKVSITDANDSIYRYTNYENTLKAIREKLVERLGGYLKLRHENDKLYLDWITLAEYGKYCSQPIEFGLNMLDYSLSRTAENIVTALIPLGARLEGESEIDALEKYVDITSANGGSNYIYNQTAVENFGWIWATNTWQDVTEPSNLLRKAKKWLTDNQFEDLTLELTAVDLSMMDGDYDFFDIGDRIRCRAKPYGMDRIFPVMELQIPLQKPDGATLTLGEKRKLTYTEQQSRIYSGVTATAEERRKIQNEEIKAAIDNLTAKMTGSAGGYKLEEYDENGLWLRDLYMDAPDKEQATNILQINKEGIGGSHNGYSGPYTVGMTLDGQIVGERIMANSISAEKLTAEYKTELEGRFTQAGRAANDYTDQRETAVKEIITTSIKTVEDNIQLAVTDQQSTANRYNYVTNGESITISENAFTADANLTVAMGEAANISAVHLTKTDNASAALRQDLGTLEPGVYEIEMKIFIPNGKKPSNCYLGLNGYNSFRSFSSMKAETWYTIRNTVTLTSQSKRMFYFGLYGASGKEIYVTDIRVLRDVKELINDVDARITVEAGKITEKVTETYEANSHDYCENGTFKDVDGEWYRNNTAQISYTTYKDKTCAKLVNTDTINYIRHKQMTLPRQGKVRVRFKAACLAKNAQTARIRLSIGDKVKYTTVGDLSTEWKTFEFEAIVQKGSFYVYIYNNVKNTTIYITDVEILGYATHYAEAQLQVTANGITAEVTRAKKAEETLKSSITVNEKNIKLRVEKGNVSSEISTEAGKIAIKSNRISIESTNFTLTAAGYVTMKGATCKGDFETSSGDWWIKLSHGQMTGGYGDNQYGKIDFVGEYANSEEHTLRIAGNTCIDIKGFVHTARNYNDGKVFKTFSGTRDFITKITSENGTLKWTTTTFSFINGMLL